MPFQRDLARIPNLNGTYKPGLGAIRKKDKERIGAEKPKQICGSADIDAALTPSHPNEPRWDYVVCRQASRERLFWIEVHPANGGNRLREMEGKISWLRKWLDGDARLLRSRDQEFIWVASGGSAYTQRSPAIKQLALQGLQFKGGCFEIPAE